MMDFNGPMDERDQNRMDETGIPSQGDGTSQPGSNAGWSTYGAASQEGQQDTGSQQTGWTAQDHSQDAGSTASEAPGQDTQYGGWNASGYTQPNAQPGAQPGGDYNWKFEDYDAAAGRGKPPKQKKPKTPGKNRGLKVFAGILGGVMALGVLTFSGYGVYSAFFRSGSLQAGGSNSQQSSSSQENLPSLNVESTPESETSSASADGKLTAREVAAKVKPSVVGVVQYQYGSSSIEASGEGSGIIMTSDGYIITNAHVISGASGIKVVLNNGEEYEARVIGSDTRTDLAVIKIEANNLTPAEFGESSKMQEGDIVMAIGNPGGLTFAGSITQGILSGVNRQLSSSYGTTSVLQTDAAINPGNSGGALGNEYGQVIGINSSKISATDYEGIGFAIPIDDAKPIVDDLIQNGRVTGRVVLGVYNAQSVDEVASRVYGVPTGVLVGGTDPESDLAQKGVITGDIITKINNTDVTSTADIYTVLQDFEVGDSVKLTVFRRTSGQSDKTFEVTVTLMEDTGETTTQSQQQGSQRGQSQNESESGGWFSSFR